MEQRLRHKTIAQQISNLVNQDAAAEKTAIQIGNLTEGTDSNGIAKPLNVCHEFWPLPTAMKAMVKL